MERRLAAILAADVVGYSRLVERDEVGTFERLRAHRKELFEPEIDKHHGRIFKLMGDGLLVEFSSIVNAVACAMALQDGLSARNRDLVEDKKIEARIGINLGDVIVDGEDRHGEGVIIAARLQQLADPGGILVSGTTFDQVEKKLGIEFEYLGEQRVKNIEKPVRLYRVLWRDSSVAKIVAPTKVKHERRWTRFTTPTIALLLAAGAAGLWIMRDRDSPLSVETASMEKMALPLPDKPSVAVLPFTNMSSEPGQENFTDGMTDDLITDLSKVSGLFVISRNSTFTYKGKPVKVSQVAEELGVHYVLEGSVQRAGDQLRVNAQLIDALTGGHMWAERYDGNISDLFAAQDAFVSRIVEALKVTLTPAEKQQIASGKTSSISAKEAFDEGWRLYLRYDPKDTAAAIAALEKAIAIDPQYGRAYAAISLVYLRIYDAVWFKEFGMPPEQVWGNVTGYLQLAEKHPTSLSHVARAMVDTCSGHPDSARREASLAIASDPNDPEAHIAMAIALAMSGQAAEALEFVAAAKRLNPNYPPHYILAHGIALVTAGSLDQAATVLQEGVEQNPTAVSLFVPLSSVLVQLGRRAEAHQLLVAGWAGADQAEIERLARAISFPYRWDSQHQNIQRRLVDGFRVATLSLDVSVAGLTAKLKDGNASKRHTAAMQLGWFGALAADAVLVLIEALNDDVLQFEVIRTLGKIGPAAKAAIPALSAMKDNPNLGADVKDALKDISRN